MTTDSQAHEIPTDGGPDPFEWLEDVEAPEALAWVGHHNDVARERLVTDRFRRLEAEVLEVLDSTDKIPGVVQRGSYLYNFWTDADHERGLWRRTTWESYRSEEPEWEVLLDIDELAEREGVNWVWHGAHVLRPSHDRALVALSRGGADADITREFDLVTKTFVADGFTREEAKGSLRWADESGNVVFAATDVGEGSMTNSGYPRTVRRWQRGTPLAEAPEVFAVAEDDLLAAAAHDFTPGFSRDVFVRAIAFYSSRTYLREASGELRHLAVPDSAEVDVHREWLLVELREDWQVGSRTYAGGSLLAAPVDDFLSGARDFEVLFAPTPETSLVAVAWTRHHLVLNTLHHVTNRLNVLTPPDSAGDAWRRRDLVLPAQVPALTTIAISAIDPDAEDTLWLTVSGFLTPTTLSRLTLADDGTVASVEELKSAPAFFDATGLEVTQHFATSADGTRVPYFQVGPRAADGPQPTLLSGYGGFEIPRLPAYSGTVGRGWLARGGTYVVAGIRGGG
ncbi:MAG TPA: S9 family peptidase, partial [Actinomycetaceae bacterium]|nr:S9 family peptidase [Actinomycetaceae bacterium]